MKIRARLKIVAAFGLLGVAGLGYHQARAGALVGFFSPHPSIEPDGRWTIHPGGGQVTNVEPRGAWAEVINATPRWLVVQTEDGVQYPIAADRIKQFLVRWPSSADQLTANSAVEVTGPEGPQNTVIADHIDHYEADAQNLVSPTVQSFYGSNRTISPFELAQKDTFSLAYYLTPEEYNIPSRLHIVAPPLSNNPIRLAGFANSVYTVVPSNNGMTISQISMGNVGFARRGDIAYITADNFTARSLDVNQLVLYKKIPIRQFQP